MRFDVQCGGGMITRWIETQPTLWKDSQQVSNEQSFTQYTPILSRIPFKFSYILF